MNNENKLVKTLHIISYNYNLLDMLNLNLELFKNLNIIRTIFLLQTGQVKNSKISNSQNIQALR